MSSVACLDQVQSCEQVQVGLHFVFVPHTTKQLPVCLQPMPVPSMVCCTASIQSLDGRKAWLSAVLCDEPGGTVYATGKALYLGLRAAVCDNTSQQQQQLQPQHQQQQPPNRPPDARAQAMILPQTNNSPQQQQHHSVQQQTHNSPQQQKQGHDEAKRASPWRAPSSLAQQALHHGTHDVEQQQQSLRQLPWVQELCQRPGLTRAFFYGRRQGLWTDQSVTGAPDWMVCAFITHCHPSYWSLPAHLNMVVSASIASVLQTK